MHDSVAHWPTGLDALATTLFLALVTMTPAIGYLFMVQDFRSYLRSLRRALVRVRSYFPSAPDWARYETPGCLLALGLQLPCSEDELKQAYRRRVKALHPDRGGDQRRFLMLQSHFEQALRVLRDEPVTVPVPHPPERRRTR